MIDVLIGSFFSSRAPDRYIRPAITFVIFASGLKYIGVGTTTLGWILCGVLLAAGIAWLGYAQPWRNGTPDKGAGLDRAASPDWAASPDEGAAADQGVSTDPGGSADHGVGTEDPLTAGPQAPG